jgi:hypothetical protein
MARAEAKQERTSQLATRTPSEEGAKHEAGEKSETPAETARRIYRMGGEPEPRAKRRGAKERPLKWRKGG